MLLIDVNVLVYAFREDAPDHLAYRRWLTDTVSSGELFGLADLVLSGFLRVTTVGVDHHRRWVQALS